MKSAKTTKMTNEQGTRGCQGLAAADCGHNRYIQAEIALLKEKVSRLEKNIRKLSQNEDEIWEQR